MQVVQWFTVHNCGLIVVPVRKKFARLYPKAGIRVHIALAEFALYFAVGAVFNLVIRRAFKPSDSIRQRMPGGRRGAKSRGWGAGSGGNSLP